MKNTMLSLLALVIALCTYGITGRLLEIREAIVVSGEKIENAIDRNVIVTACGEGGGEIKESNRLECY